MHLKCVCKIILYGFITSVILKLLKYREPAFSDKNLVAADLGPLKILVIIVL